MLFIFKQTRYKTRLSTIADQCYAAMMCDAILGPIAVHASQKEEFQRQLVEWEPMTLQTSSKPNEDDKSRCKQILKKRGEWIRTKMYRVQMLRSCSFVSTADGSSLGLHGGTLCRGRGSTTIAYGLAAGYGRLNSCCSSTRAWSQAPKSTESAMVEKCWNIHET